MAKPRGPIRCKHDPFKHNTLIVESSPFNESRIRCKACGHVSAISRKGRVLPAGMRVQCSEAEQPPSFSPNFDERNGIRD